MTAVRPPLAQAARSLEQATRPFGDPLGINDITRELELSFESGADSELLLYTQARLLDAMFKRILLRDMHSVFADKNGVPFLQDEKVTMALRSQRQARQTVEALEAQRRHREKKERL